MALARYLADKSALARMHLADVSDALGPLIERGLVATCGIVVTEMLYSVRNVTEHDRTREWISILEWLPTPDGVWERVHDMQRPLTGHPAQWVVARGSCP